jgi:hypothetical protein
VFIPNFKLFKFLKKVEQTFGKNSVVIFHQIGDVGAFWLASVLCGKGCQITELCLEVKSI